MNIPWVKFSLAPLRRIKKGKTMVDIQGQGFTVTPALNEYVWRRLEFVLTRRNQRIARVTVRLGDANGPRGGIDKYCRIRVHLVAAPAAMVEEVGDDLYAAIDRAAERVGRSVGKRLDRTLPLRDAKRHGARPARNHYQGLLAWARGDLA
jgi:putative sigma-54 modulation protein